MERVIGQVGRVNGPVVEACNIFDAKMLELVKVGDIRITGEIIKLEKDTAVIQVYEDTTGICPGEKIYGSNTSMSVELGPGLIGSIYDGIQRPLNEIEKVSGAFIKRGIEVHSIDRKKKWLFEPAALRIGDRVEGGEALGFVQESEQIQHRILVPPTVSGEIIALSSKGEYRVDEEIAIVKNRWNAVGQSLTLMQRWPIREPRPVAERRPPSIPLITGQRVIDTLFPLAKGGTVTIPGGFGTGKTMTQHAIAKWCDADIIVYIGCGERGNEMTDVLNEFPELIDPRTNRSLMERTILIANTSNMPVSAREASIYTGITLAEYYRDMGYHVAIMADSTSRWAEALRELSGRMEEMPAEEGFPAYLPTKIAEFYERAGYMITKSEKEGSVSIIGAVSPPGGDFSEPVTQHTKRFVRCFWGLDRALANARHYPAISWLESYSEYLDDITGWWEDKVSPDWPKNRQEIMELLQKEVRLQQVVKLVGPDALPDSQRFIIDVCALFKNAFLQQNAFDDIDRFSVVEKQYKMLLIILTYYRAGLAAIKKGATLIRLKQLPIYSDIARMKYNVPNTDLSLLDKLLIKTERAINRLEVRA